MINEQHHLQLIFVFNSDLRIQINSNEVLFNRIEWFISKYTSHNSNKKLAFLLALAPQFFSFALHNFIIHAEMVVAFFQYIIVSKPLNKARNLIDNSDN